MTWVGEYEYKILENAQKQNIPVVIVVSKAEEKVYSKFDRLFYTRDPPLADYTDITQKAIKEAKERVQESMKHRRLQETPVFVVSARKYRTFMIEQGRLESANDQENNNNTTSFASEQLSVEDSNDGTNNNDDHRVEQHEKNAVLSFELNHLLDHLATAALHRRL